MSKNLSLLLVAVCVLLGVRRVGAQTPGMSVNATGAAADASAMLDVSSATQGMLMPRMTAAQRAAIGSPATGLLVYQTDGTAGFYIYNGGAWVSLSSTSGTVTSVSTTDSDPLLTSTVSNATTTPVITFSTTPAAAHTFFGNFTGSTGAPSYSSPALNSADFANQGTTTTVLHGNAAGNPSFGQITNADVAAGAGIVYSKLSVSGSIQPTLDLNSTGVPSVTTFLRGDNSWQAPFALTTTGSGAATFSGGTLNIPTSGGGTVTSVSIGNLAPIFTATVTSSTTTPAISYTLTNAGAYSVLTNSVNGVGATSYGKVVPGALYDPGNTISATKFYRGDGQWATPVAPGIAITSYSSSIPVPATVNCAVANASGITLTFPSAASYGAGQILYISSGSGIGFFNVHSAGSDVIKSGSTTAAVSGGQNSTSNSQSLTMGGVYVSDGVNTWYSIMWY